MIRLEFVVQLRECSVLGDVLAEEGLAFGEQLRLFSRINEFLFDHFHFLRHLLHLLGVGETLQILDLRLEFAETLLECLLTLGHLFGKVLLAVGEKFEPLLEQLLHGFWPLVQLP